MTCWGNDPRRDRRLVRQQLRVVCRELNESRRVTQDRGRARAATLCTCSTSSPTNRHLRTMLRVRRNAEAQLRAELRELRAQGRLYLAQTEQTMTHLRSELDEAQLRNAEQQTNVARLERVNAWSQERMAGRADLVAQLRGKLDALRREHASCAERLTTIRIAARAEIDRLRSEIDMLTTDAKAARARITAANGEVVELQTKLTNARRDQDALGARAVTIEAELQVAYEQLAATADELRIACAQRDALKHEFAASVGANKDVIRFLNDRLTAAEKETLSFKKQRDAANRERAAVTRERDALAADLVKMTDERDQLRAQVATLPEHVDELRAFQRKLFAREAQLIAQERHLATLIDQQKRVLEERFIGLAKGA